MRNLNSSRFIVTTGLALALGAGISAQATEQAPPPPRPAAPTAAAPQTVSTSTANIGTVRLGQAVKADGQALPAGTYQVRLTTEAPPKVVGQTVAETRWVEFMKGSTVAGREVATVLTPEEMAKVADRPRGRGAARIETLKGGDYLRVWVTHGGQHVLIHLPATK